MGRANWPISCLRTNCTGPFKGAGVDAIAAALIPAGRREQSCCSLADASAAESIRWSEAEYGRAASAVRGYRGDVQGGDYYGPDGCKIKRVSN